MADNSEYNIRFNYTDNSDLLAGNNAKVGASFNLLGGRVGALALRFVGYNLILNQIMSAQQKLIDFIGDSVGAFREFQLRMAEISSIMEESDIPMMDQLALGVQALSQAYGKSSSDMAKGLYEIISAAFSAKDSLNLLTTATKASVAGLTDIKTSVDIFTTVLNAYGKTVEQATNISNILFQSVVRGKFQFEDLESALGFIVPIAAQSGIAFNDLMAALSSVTRQGIHLDMASRGLALMIQNIINPTEGATKAADKYGIEMNSLALESMGLRGWFEQLNTAIHEFGTKILGELIPNMRSLRVAMVLAGDEGLAGFNEDLEKLANMGNRVEKALTSIMNTSQFVSSQLTQQFEQVKRDVGKSWDEMVMGIQRGILGVVKFFVGADYEPQAFKKFSPVKDDDVATAKAYINAQEQIQEYSDRRLAIEKDIAHLKFKQEQSYKGSMAYKQAGEDIEELTDEYDELGTEIIALEANNANLVDSFNRIKSSVLDGIDALGNLDLKLGNISLSIEEYEDKLKNDKTYGWGEGLKIASVNISDLTSLTDKQRDALEKLGTSFKGTLAYQYLQLKSNKDYEDSQHDVAMGLELVNYNYKTIPQNIRDAIDAVRNYTKAQDENRKSNELMSAAMRELQIRALQIQLAGMSKRRGLSRSEQKELKKIEIEQAKMRLANMQAEKAATSSDISNYNNKQQIIDDYLLKLKE
jgi:TP901 family phage tail tape measure protein